MRIKELEEDNEFLRQKKVRQSKIIDEVCKILGPALDYDREGIGMYDVVELAKEAADKLKKATDWDVCKKDLADIRKIVR